MTDSEKAALVQKVIDCLNTAYQSDPAALHAMIDNRVPCNDKLANHPYVVCDAEIMQQDKKFLVGPLGLINGILAAMELPLVCGQFSNDTDTLEGFDFYKQRSEA